MKKSIKQVIKERKSTRDYSTKRIEETKRKIMLEEMKNLSNERFRFDLIDYTFENGAKIGTYGMIKGGHSFIIGILKKDLAFSKEASLEFGSAFEELILKATEIELDTCWMVSTFNDKDIRQLINIKSDENIVMVSPIGYQKDKSFRDKITRRIIGAHKRKPWKEIFFDSNFDKPLETVTNEGLKDALESLRLSPSAANKQPWRIVVESNYIDFYTVKNSFSEKSGQKINVNFNDIGIAKCHFQKVASENGIKLEWQKKSNSLIEHEYVGSFKLI